MTRLVFPPTHYNSELYTYVCMHIQLYRQSLIIFQKAQSHISMVFDLVSYNLQLLVSLGNLRM